MFVFSEFCTQFQLGSKGAISLYENGKQGSDLTYNNIETKDVMVQTDVEQDQKDSYFSGNLLLTRKSGAGLSHRNKGSLLSNGIQESDTDGKVSPPIKRRRGRPRKGTTNITIEKESTVEVVDEKPQIIQIKAPSVNQELQALRVSARVRDRVLTGKYKDFREKDPEVGDNDGKHADEVMIPNDESMRVVYQCSVCDHLATSLEGLTRHQNLHIGNNKLLSEKSDSSSSKELEVDQSKGENLHKENTSNTSSGVVCTNSRHMPELQVGKHVCDKCDFSTSKVKEFDQHKKEHLHAENQCSFCGWICEKAEANSPEFQEHLEKHSGPEPYFCTVCHLRFKTKTKLLLHTPKHSEIKPFVCDQCGAGFKWKHALKNHMIVHKDTKDYLCDFCGFSTAHKSQMTSHRLIHTGETLKCTEPDCTFIATKRTHLQYHMLTHTHEKPHQCEVCGQSFTLIKNMKRHMLLHSQGRSFKCEKCPFSTTRLDKLKDHYWKQHNIGAAPGKKFRLKDYLEVKQPADMETEVAAAEIEVAEIPREETQTIELQIAESGIMGDTANSTIHYIETSTGETFPIAVTEVVGDAQLAEIQYPEIEISNLQTMYISIPPGPVSDIQNQ